MRWPSSFWAAGRLCGACCALPWMFSHHPLLRMLRLIVKQSLPTIQAQSIQTDTNSAGFF